MVGAGGGDLVVVKRISASTGRNTDNKTNRSDRSKEAGKLKSCKMKEGWMKNDEGWMKNDEGWWFQAVEGFW